MFLEKTIGLTQISHEILFVAIAALMRFEDESMRIVQIPSCESNVWRYTSLLISALTMCNMTSIIAHNLMKCLYELPLYDRLIKKMA